MIAKLIVRGPDRRTAIQKLNAALSEYEIAGPITNVDFLQKVCKSPAFVAGDVETGYIKKWESTLFQTPEVPDVALMQAALGAYFAEVQENHGLDVLLGAKAGFVAPTHKRIFCLAPVDGDGSRRPNEKTIEVEQTGSGIFSVSLDGSTQREIMSSFDRGTRTVLSHFPHTRLESRFIENEDNIVLFQQGHQYRFRRAKPEWVEKALGIKDTAHSVLAPMPCKILRVEAEPGQEVRKDQVLVVIESMKMETSIRSPQDGVVSRIVHQQGVGNFSSSLEHS